MLVLGIGIARLDLNDYKPAIIDAVRNATGRTLSLDGPVTLRWSFQPTIVLSNVTLSNLSGGSRPDIARIERIQARLSLATILRRQIEVVQLTLTGPNILFEEVGTRPNWILSPPETAARTPSGGAGMPFQIRIRRVDVRNGMVTFRLPARTKVVGIRSLEVAHPTDRGPLRIEAILVYSDYEPFSLRASAQPTGGPSDPWKTQLALSAFDTSASAQGLMDVAGHFDLQVEARSGAIEKLNALLPEMRLPAVHRLSLSTHLMNGTVPGDLPVVGATQLHFGDADLSDRVSGLKLGATAVRLAAAGGLATVESSGQIAGEGFTLTGTIGVPVHPDARSDVAYDLIAQTVPTDRKPGIGSLSLKGRMTLDALRFRGTEAEAALRMPDLAWFRPLLSQRIPAFTDVRFGARLVVPADRKSISFQNAKFLTPQGDISGDGKIGLDNSPTLSARLQSKILDLDALFHEAGIDLSPSVRPLGADRRMIPDTPLPWELLHGPSIDVTTRVDAMTFQGERWRKVDLEFRLKDGRVEAATAKLPLSGGPLDVSITADALVEPQALKLSAHAPGIPLALVARYIELPGEVSGNMLIDTRLSAAGRSLHDLAASLNGTVSASAVDARISNTGLIDLTAPALEALGIKVPDQGNTKVACMGLAVSFADGVGRLNTIALQSTYLSFAGFGQIDLGHETVALKLNPLAQISGSPVSVPVLVEGPFRAVSATLDATGLDKLGLLIDAWFGGDHPDTCSDAELLPSRTP